MERESVITIVRQIVKWHEAYLIKHGECQRLIRAIGDITRYEHSSTAVVVEVDVKFDGGTGSERVIVYCVDGGLEIDYNPHHRYLTINGTLYKLDDTFQRGYAKDFLRGFLKNEGLVNELVDAYVESGKSGRNRYEKFLQTGK